MIRQTVQQPVLEPVIDSIITLNSSDEEILSNEYKHFESASAYTVDVRPWLINNCSKKRNINTMTQFAFYKCMKEWCVYATDSQKNWKIHMQEHTNSLNKNQIDKDQIKLANFYDCPYCGDEQSVDGRHMEMEHRGSILQCAFCYYRTIEIDNILLHMATYHPNVDRETLVCGWHRKFRQKDEETIRNECKRNVTRIKCAVGKVQDTEVPLFKPIIQFLLYYLR